jgi:hypothetical protein
MSQDRPTPRMTEEEFLRRLEQCQTMVSEGMERGESTDALNARYAALEFDLIIDYRLGRDFPQERRRALSAIRDRFEREKGGLVREYAERHAGEDELRQRLQDLVDAMVARYAEVLTPDEYRDFVGSITGIIGRPDGEHE